MKVIGKNGLGDMLSVFLKICFWIGTLRINYFTICITCSSGLT